MNTFMEFNELYSSVSPQSNVSTYTYGDSEMKTDNITLNDSLKRTSYPSSSTSVSLNNTLLSNFCSDVESEDISALFLSSSPSSQSNSPKLGEKRKADTNIDTEYLSKKFTPDTFFSDMQFLQTTTPRAQRSLSTTSNRFGLINSMDDMQLILSNVPSLDSSPFFSDVKFPLMEQNESENGNNILQSVPSPKDSFTSNSTASVLPSPPNSIKISPKASVKTPNAGWNQMNDFSWMMNMSSEQGASSINNINYTIHDHIQQPIGHQLSMLQSIPWLKQNTTFKQSAMQPNPNFENTFNNLSQISDALKKKCIWTPEEDSMLLKGFQMYPKQWAKIASMIPGRTNQQVKQRWSYVLNEDIRNGPWSDIEDQLLTNGFQIHGKQWAKIASMIPGRTNIQCRNRWKDVLDPSIRSGPWSIEEDEILQRGYLQFGTKWSKISNLLPGRTGLQCRDRFIRRAAGGRKRK